MPGSGFCTTKTFPRRCTVPWAANGSRSPRTGHGRPATRIGRTEQRHRWAAGGCGKMRYRRIGARERRGRPAMSEVSCGQPSAPSRRPIWRRRPRPCRDRRAPSGGRTAGRDHRKSARCEVLRDLPPTMTCAIACSERTAPHAGRHTDRMARRPQRYGARRHNFRRPARSRSGRQVAASPRPDASRVASDMPDAAACALIRPIRRSSVTPTRVLSGNDRKEGGPVTCLGRDREIVATKQLPREREAVACGRADRDRSIPRRYRDCRTGWPRCRANTSTSIRASGQARRRLRISGVVSSTSPSRRSATTRMRGFAGRSSRGLTSRPRTAAPKAAPPLDAATRPRRRRRRPRTYRSRPARNRTDDC